MFAREVRRCASLVRCPWMPLGMGTALQEHISISRWRHSESKRQQRTQACPPTAFANDSTI
eukprot:4655945-Pyramimonas_sp.AAC.1